MTSVPDPVQARMLSREFWFACRSDGTVSWADERAQHIGLRAATSLWETVADGSRAKAERFIAAACAAETEPWELMLRTGRGAALASVRGAPDSDGAVIVGTLLPEDYHAVHMRLTEALQEMSRLQRETERQRRSVQDEQEQLRQIVEALPEAILVVDAAGQTRYVNAVAEAITGIDFATTTLPMADDHPFGARRADGSQIPARDLPLQRSLTNGEAVSGEEVVIYNQQRGRNVILLVSSVPLRDPNGTVNGALAVFRDIGPIKQLEQQKDEFLASIAHDLRSPLSVIVTRLGVMERWSEHIAEPERERLLDGLRRTELAARRVAGMLDDLLDVARLQLGNPRALALERLDLLSMIREAIEDRAEASAVRVEAGVDEPVIGLWDRNRLARAFGNLIDNAIRYSQPGADVRVSIGREDAMALVTVEDEGIGIPAHDLPRVFDRFFRADNAVMRHAGSGIGLASTKEIIEQHGGSISAHSQEGRGSRFEIRLPLPDQRGAE